MWPIKRARLVADYVTVWTLLDLMVDLLLDYRWVGRPLREFRAERKAGRQRERVFAATQLELSRQRAAEAAERGADYFVN